MYAMYSLSSFALAFYSGYEVLLFLAAYALVARFVQLSSLRHGFSERCLAVLSLKIVLGCSIGMGLTFVKANGELGFGIAAACLCAFVAYWLWWMHRTGQAIWPALSSKTALDSKSILTASVIAVLLLPVLIGVAGPTSETDSLTSLNYMLKWIQQGSIPYDFFYNYVSFFECGQLPAVVIGKSDALFWVVSVQTVLIFGLAAYRLARGMDLPHGISLLLAVNGVAIFHFWGGVSGVGSIKNDMLYNAGIVLTLCALVRISTTPNERMNTLLLFCGITFASVKFSGPAIMAIALGGCLIFSFLGNDKNAITSLKAAVPLAIGLSIVTCGHFYIRNILQHSNPVYPLKIHFPGFTLPGPLDYRSTSIAASWDKPEVWRLFLGSPREGLLFPVFFIAFLCLIPMTIFPRFWQNRGWTLRWLFITTAACWLIYFGSPWSAEVAPGTLDILASHSSFRYATAADFLSRLGVVAALAVLLPRSLGVVFGVMLVDTATRFHILYAEIIRIGAGPLVLPVTIAAGTLVAITAILLYSRRLICYGLVLAMPAGLVFASPVIGEANRGRWWLNEFKPVTMSLARAGTTEVFVVDEPSLWGIRYPASGVRFQHKVTVGTERQLGDRMASCGTAPGAVVLFGLGKISAQLVSRISLSAERCGLSVFGKNDFSVLYYRPPTININTLGATERTASMVDGDVQQTEFLSATPLVLSSADTPQRLWLRSSTGIKAVQGETGQLVHVNNLGGFKEGGTYAGLDLEWVSGNWRFSAQSIAATIARYSFSPLLVNGQANPSWLLAGAGPVSVSSLEEGGRRFVRVKASGQMPWMAAMFKARTRTNRDPLTLMGEIRVGGEAAASVTAYAAGKQMESIPLPATGKWVKVTNSQLLAGPNIEYAFAIGLGSVPAASYFDLSDVSILHMRVPSCIGDVCRWD